MYEIRDLRIVLAIHENGSLARAARVLGVAQPALTRHLAALETRLRGQLFERGRRGVIATDLGRMVVARAEGILERVDDLSRSTAEVRGDQVRDMTVAAGAYMAETICVAAATRMVPMRPQVRLRLVTANWTEVPRMIHERAASIGLLDMRAAREDPGLEIEPLRPHPGFFVVRPGHPLTGRAGIGLADILALPMVFIGRVPTAIQVPMAAARTQARAAGGMHPAFPALVHESPAVALAAVMHADLVAAVTPAVAAAALRAGTVVALPWREPWLSVHPGIIRLRNRTLGDAEQVYLDLLREADREAADAAMALCSEIGLPVQCIM